MECDAGYVQFALPTKTTAVRGNGVKLRIELCPAVKEGRDDRLHGVCPMPNGAWEADFWTYGKFLFNPILGKTDVITPEQRKMRYDAVDFKPAADENENSSLQSMTTWWK
jgi:hypothetical protein